MNRTEENVAALERTVVRLADVVGDRLDEMDAETQLVVLHARRRTANGNMGAET